MNRAPICRDCRHFIPGDNPKCGAVPARVVTDVVLGTEEDNPYAVCRNQRAIEPADAYFSEQCGVLGNLFQPRAGDAA
jgi:hypothetical protein